MDTYGAGEPPTFRFHVILYCHVVFVLATTYQVTQRLAPDLLCKPVGVPVVLARWRVWLNVREPMSIPIPAHVIPM